MRNRHTIFVLATWTEKSDKVGIGGGQKELLEVMWLLQQATSRSQELPYGTARAKGLKEINQMK